MVVNQTTCAIALNARNDETPAIAEVPGGGPPGIRTLNLRIKSSQAAVRTRLFPFDPLRKPRIYSRSLSRGVRSNPIALVVEVVVIASPVTYWDKGDKGAKDGKGANGTSGYHLTCVRPHWFPVLTDSLRQCTLTVDVHNVHQESKTSSEVAMSVQSLRTPSRRVGLMHLGRMAAHETTEFGLTGHRYGATPTGHAPDHTDQLRHSVDGHIAMRDHLVSGVAFLLSFERRRR